MLSTQKNITADLPSSKQSLITNKFLFYPQKKSNKRILEGGIRTQGLYKHSLPDMPLVTVITVCFNSVKTIEQSIQSILSQTYENIEYIIVDGHSDDGTLDLIKSNQDAIDYFLSEPDEGLYHAMNKGLELATGEYIIFLNSDDWYENQCIDTLVKGIKASHADFSTALASRVEENGTFIDVLPRMPYNDSIRFGMSLRHELMLIHKDIYETIGGYNEEYRIIADFEFAIRLYEAGYTLHEINRPLLNFRVSGISNTNWTQLIFEHNKLFKQQFPDLSKIDAERLSDPRKFSAHLINEVIQANLDNSKLVSSLVSYGYRREFYSSSVIPTSHVKLSPRISIIVPVYNSSKTLTSCIKSILCQNITNIEVICVNDYSTDNSLQILKEFQQTDDRIIIINNLKNYGVASSRNKAINIAQGEYIFFVDSDDEITLEGLGNLIKTADLHHSDIVKGCFERMTDSGESLGVFGLPLNRKDTINTSIYKTPELLTSTEGFWSMLYRRTIVKNCIFSNGMVMGEDSLFLVKSYLQALSITWINSTVYRYRQHSKSTMKNIDLKKCLDMIEWRRRAWILLEIQGLKKSANWLAHGYWDQNLLENIDNILGKADAKHFRKKLSQMLICTAIKEDSLAEAYPVKKLLKQSTNCNDTASKNNNLSGIRVGVFNSFDRGGAAIGSIRRINALRNSGVNATLHSLVSNSQLDFVNPLTNKHDQDPLWEKVIENAIKPPKNEKGFCATELFSLPFSIINYFKYKELFSSLDIIHFHWVVGIFDYENIGEVLGDKPVFWTLADMNAFTGGCHYSEGCTEFKHECRSCHLLGKKSTLAHKSWKLKKNAYSKIKNLTIICPSQWMADQVKQSSLLGGRPIAMISNAFPIDEIKLINMLLARTKLGLPLNKKLILFGADSLASKRKGGDILENALNILIKSDYDTNNIEIVSYGHHSLKLPLHTHNLGFLSVAETLSLVYSACNVYAFPSREDNAPLTVGESLLSGTPVVSFPVGNTTDLIQHKLTGYIASYGDAIDFAEGIKWALNIKNSPETIRGLHCRITASNFHNPEKAANKHIKLYNKSLKLSSITPL